MYVTLMASATVVGDNTQQRPGLRGTPAKAGEPEKVIPSFWKFAFLSVLFCYNHRLLFQIQLLFMRFSFVTAFILSAFTSVAQSKAIISGTILNSRSDSVTIIYGESGRSGGSKIVKVPLVNNKFRQILRIPYLHSIEVTDGAGYVTGFIEPNDDIKIEADFASNTSKPKFDGKGKEKSIYYQSYRSYAPLLRSRVAEAKLESQPIDYMLKIVDSLTNKY